ncbi:MAG: hypothetical protein AABY15_05700 [Nanoarchaeota archaeon]
MEDVRKIVREILNEVIGPEIRYVAEMDFYIWAKDDEDARMQAHQMASDLSSRFDNRAKITKIGKQPSGTLDFFPIDPKSGT